MADVFPQIILVLVLVVLNAAFAGTELALVSLREGQLQRLESRSATGALLARLARQPNQFLATIQVGITLAGFLASATAAVSLAEPLEEPLGFLGASAGPASIVVVTLLLSYLTLVFGELAPKRVAMQRAERWGLAMARPLAVLTALTRPVVWLLSHSTDLAVRAMGADPDQQREEITEEELRDMVAAQDSFTGEHRQIIDGAFEITQRRLKEVLVSRHDVVLLDADSTCSDAVEVLVATGHSRAPVADDGNLDRVRGVVNLRLLLGGGDETVGSMAMPAPIFPDGASVLTTMREMQATRTQMAIVFNERGGADGIVTMEDLVEELVGDIYDEHDPDHVAAASESDGTVVLPGHFPVHDLADIDIEVPAGRYATVAGLVLHVLGRLPSIGERVDVDGHSIQVRAMEHFRITQVAITRPVRVVPTPTSRTE